MLTIDIGNTKIKIGVWEESKLVNVISFAYAGIDIKSKLSEVLLSCSQQDEVIICSVAADKNNDSVREWLKDNWNVLPDFVASDKQFAELKNGYKVPSQLGNDRWVAIISAYMQYQKAVCVIDCGTAVTIDVVDSLGQHLGGLIMPGLNTMQQSLLSNTDGIRESQGIDVFLANNTSDAVFSGCNQLLISGLNGLIGQYKKQLGDELVCVVTGGDGEMVKQQLQHDCYYEKDLILYGLQLLANHNN